MKNRKSKRVWSSPAINGGRIYFGSEDENLYALSDVVYIAGRDNIIYALV